MIRRAARGTVLAGLLVASVACQSAAPSAPASPVAPVSKAAAEAWVDDALDVNKFIAGGKLLYERERSTKSAVDLCRGGQDLIDRGELRLGIREKMMALYRSEDIRDYLLAAQCARGLAIGYSFAGNFDAAVQWADHALAYLKLVGATGKQDQVNGVYTPVMKIKGDAAMHRGQIDAAIKDYEAALASSPTNWRPWVLSAFANAEISRKNSARAADLLAKAEAEANPALKALIQRGRGQLMLTQGQFDEAIAHFESAVKSSQAARNPYETMWAQYGLARAQAAKGEKTKAIASYRLAVRTSERVRSQFRSEEYRSGFYGDVQAIFDEAVDVQFTAGNVAEALAVSEQSRARSLLDMVRGRVKLAEGGSTFVDAVGKPATPAAIRGAVPAGVAVVVYHTLRDKTVAWVVRSDAITGVLLPRGREALDGQVRDLRRAIVARSREQTETTARSLYDGLIGPLDLRDGERVIFVPHQALHYLPFGALRGPRGWLLEQHVVARAPSASALVAITQRPALEQGRVLALGNPDLGEARLALPGAEREVRSIQAVYPDASVFTKGDATKVRFMTAAPANRLVHVAAHATVDDIDPLYSVIRLADADGQRGDLEAREVYALKLDETRLVVLSACATGMGRVARGDEFMGFERVFLGAGARSLIITLWPIVDVSTAQLMTVFYRQLQSAPLADALRAAQLELLRSSQYGDPLFWAAFSPVGDWR